MDFHERVLSLRRSRRRFAICTVVETSGSSPRKSGAKMIVLFEGGQVGTIGGGAIEYEVVAQARQALEAGESRLVRRHLTHELAMCCGGGMSVFVEVQSYDPRLYLFGCGHVGLALGRMAAGCGFEVKAIDPRPEYAEAGRFEGVSGSLEVICDDPLEVIEGLAFEAEGTYAVVATHDHGLDEAIVARLLGRELRYLGCIGSERKGLKFRQRLEARGFSAEAVSRMRTPMGLPIGALTPEEIAVSVLAELIAERRGGGRLESR